FSVPGFGPLSCQQGGLADCGQQSGESRYGPRDRAMGLRGLRSIGRIRAGVVFLHSRRFGGLGKENGGGSIVTSAATVGAWKTESVFKPALLLMAGRVLAFAATFFIPVVLARVFDRADFGTYKQVFLIHSTVYLSAQIGMASSLYYFLPLSSDRAGRYAANSVLCLGLSGLACLAFLVIDSARLSQWLSNADLAAYSPWIGLYLFLTLFSSPLEIAMISRRRYFWASGAYAGSDLARAAALIVPALLFRRLDLVLLCAVLVGLLRAVGAVFYLRQEFGAQFRPDGALLLEQFRYALPFGLAVLVEIAQWNYHHYAVSHRFDPAT